MTAIIGFWKLNEQEVFECFHDFTVPNPMLRQVRAFDNTALYKFLYHSEDRKRLFFFYKENPRKAPPPVKVKPIIEVDKVESRAESVVGCSSDPEEG